MMIDQLTSEYIKEVPDDHVDVFNFDFNGDIVLEHELVYAKLTVQIKNSKLIEIDEIDELVQINREGYALKHYISPYGYDLSNCKFMLFNIETIKDAIINATWDAAQIE